MTLTMKHRLRILVVGLAGSTACTVGEATGELTMSRSDDSALVGQLDSVAGPRLELEVREGTQGPTARVLGQEEGAVLRVERDEDGEPLVWVGAVPLAEASEEAARAELLRIFETEEWAAVSELVDAVEGLDAAQALVVTLREGVDAATAALAAAPDVDQPRTQGYSGVLYIYGCMNWWQARSVANGRCQSYGYSYANWVASHAWTRCGTDSSGNGMYRTFEYQCYRASAW